MYTPLLHWKGKIWIVWHYWLISRQKYGRRWEESWMLLFYSLFSLREILYENKCLLHLSGYYCSKHHLSKPMISKNSSQVLHFISTNQLIWFYFINQNPLCFGIPLLLDSCTRVFKLHRLSAGVPLFSFHSFSSAEKKILCWLPFQCRDIGLHFPFVSWSIAERNGRNND